MTVTAVSAGAIIFKSAFSLNNSKKTQGNVDLFPNEEITNPKVMSAPLLARRRDVLTFSLTVAPKP